MANNRAKLAAISLLAAKIETTTGTKIAVLATDAKFVVYNLELNPDEPTNERELTGGLGQNPSVIGLGSGTCNFEIDLMGNGASGVPPWASTFLPACGLTATGGSYAFNQDPITTITLYKYEDGLIKSLAGAMGNFVIRKSAGQPGRVAFNFRGRYAEETDASILSPTFPTVLPPVDPWVMTFGSWTPIASQVEIDAGNQVEIREDGGSAGGVYAAAIVNRKPTWTADPEATASSDRAWDTLRSASTEENFSLQVGASANNTITIASASKSQIVKRPMGNRNGIYTRQVQGQFNGLTGFGIVFS